MSFLFNESTAHGKVDTGEEYYTEWIGACTGDSDLTPFFFSSLDEPSLIMPGLRVTALDEEERELRAQFDAPLEWLAGRRFCIRNYCDGDVQKAATAILEGDRGEEIDQGSASQDRMMPLYSPPRE